MAPVVVVAVAARGEERPGSRPRPASGAPPDPGAADVAAITRLLTERLRMTAGQARKYARLVLQREGGEGSKGYVEHLIQAAKQTPNVHNPAGLVAHWITKHEAPPIPGTVEPAGPTLDPQKYLHGKYAHLFNRAGAAAAEETL
ncbi:MAG: hypothetical protein M3010_00950 [Candidatus Dormibacteraeota bacterium]|nr:hypothetical protein [Candidatus Dormibacteraeota bacterium]